MLDGRLVIADHPFDIGQIVVADGVVIFYFDCASVLVPGFEISAECSIAAAHVAEGLEEIGIVHDGAHVECNSLLKGLILLLCFTFAEGLHCLLAVHVSTRRPQFCSQLLGLRSRFELAFHNYFKKKIWIKSKFKEMVSYELKR
jgi:hypothetical protein